MMKITIIAIISLVTTLHCYAQNPIQIEGINVNPNIKFNLKKTNLDPSEISEDKLLKPIHYNMVFNSLISKKNVKFYKDPISLISNEENNNVSYYKILDNLNEFGFFFEKIDSHEKVRDLIFLSHGIKTGRIINSSKLYGKIVDELKQVNSKWVLEAKSPFDGFEVITVDDQYYLAKYLLKYGTTIAAVKCLVDHEGHLTLVDKKIIIKGPEIAKGSAVIKTHSPQALYNDAIKKAEASFGEHENDLKMDKNKRLYYYIYTPLLFRIF